MLCAMEPPLVAGLAPLQRRARSGMQGLQLSSRRRHCVLLHAQLVTPNDTVSEALRIRFAASTPSWHQRSDPPHRALNVKFIDVSQWPGSVGGEILIRLLASRWCDASFGGHYLLQTPRQLSSRSFEAAASPELSVLLITAPLRSGTCQGPWCATRHVKRGGRG